jgi:hypothetical protein
LLAKFMEFEQRSWGNVSPPVPSSPLVALADLFMHKLSEAGSMSREELVDLAVKQGFYPDAENAAQGVHPMLVNLVRSELIRELPNGTFAPTSLAFGDVGCLAERCETLRPGPFHDAADRSWRSASRTRSVLDWPSPRGLHGRIATTLERSKMAGGNNGQRRS